MSILTDIREVSDLINKVGDIELNRKIVELQGEVVNLFTENQELREQVKELRKTLRFSKTLVYKDPFYFAEGDKTPYCANCWEASKVAIHLPAPFLSAAGPVYDCPNCKNTFIHPRRQSRSIPYVEI